MSDKVSEEKAVQIFADVISEVIMRIADKLSELDRVIQESKK